MSKLRHKPDEAAAQQEIEVPLPAEDAVIDAGIAADADAHELDAAFFFRSKPVREALPQAVQKSLGVRGPQKAPRKVSTTIRLSPEVMAAFKATGAGWQTRIDAVLKEWLRTQVLKGR